MKNKTLITSALIYANGPVHIGHMVEYIQTDIYSRFLKLTGEDAIYCCADDTHGTPIEINAQKAGKTPKQFIKEWYKKHTQTFKSYHVDFDSYYSTDTSENKHYTELIFNRLKKKGHIYKKEIELTYCEHDKRFLPDRYVKGVCPKCGAEDQYGDVCEKCNAAYKTIDLIKPYCVLCKNAPIRKKSEHYFFKLSSFSKKLEKWLKGNKNLQPEIKNQILNWIKDGLEDWCISRDGPYFGFKIPGEKNKYFYVWLDAPIGYIASTANYCRNKKCSADDIWQKPGNKIIHFIGKDIIYFHLLFWPAVLMGADFNVPDNIVVHGFLTVNREKMSKSRGTFITAKDLLKYCDPEFLRYYYAANLTHTMTDIDLDLKNLTERINNELVANIANFIYRVLSFTNKHYKSEIKNTENKRLLDEIINKMHEIRIYYENFEYRNAVKELLEISSMGNKYFQDREPWFLIKENREECQKVVTDCVNVVKNLVVALKPIMPCFAEKIEKQLNLNLNWDDAYKYLENHKIGKAEIVLRKVEEIKIEVEKKGTAARKIDFSILDLKVGEIYDVSDHFQADKLYLINAKVGKEQRQLVAGLKPYYPNKKELIGKKIIIVTNLEHADLRGEKSEGMLLAAETKDGKIVEVLEAPDSKTGTQVLIKDSTPGRKIITIDEFSKIRLRVENNQVYYRDKPLQAGKKLIKTKRIKYGTVR
ncbi:methionine--tRNA ligase [Candidatus Woesearchaeota archaeon]|nr:methionine--tRNA ligase [Candidatus Woesearchaeota archaeon]